jgi:hypothetical protein
MGKDLMIQKEMKRDLLRRRGVEKMRMVVI